MTVLDLPRTIEWIEDDGTKSPCVRMIDQRQLPEELTFACCTTYEEVMQAIDTMVVRGAPAIGLAGAFGVALWAVRQSQESTADEFLSALDKVCNQLASVRPTAINLSWAVKHMREYAHSYAYEELPSLKARLVDLAQTMRADDEAMCKAIGQQGASLFANFNAAAGHGARIQTHCNAGSLATAFYGTALSVIYAAYEQGLVDKVWVDETRPVNQGSRLTAWELACAGVPATLVCDNMAATLMAQGLVDAVVVGADVVCANGDVVNKVGTYGLAVLAHTHGIPFYVAAPSSTIAPGKASADQVVIEQRSASEILDTTRAPKGMEVYNPSFDATPAKYVTAIITEKGVFAPNELVF